MMALAVDKLSSGPTQKNQGPAMGIANLVYHEVSAMEPQQRIIAKRLITEVLSLGEMGVLTMDHKIMKATFSNDFLA